MNDDANDAVNRASPSIAAPVAVGDIVLIGDDQPFWAGCLMRVEEVKAWGVKGAVTGPQNAEYPLRVAHTSIVTVYRRIDHDQP